MLLRQETGAGAAITFAAGAERRVQVGGLRQAARPRLPQHVRRRPQHAPEPLDGEAARPAGRQEPPGHERHGGHLSDHHPGRAAGGQPLLRAAPGSCRRPRELPAVWREAELPLSARGAAARVVGLGQRLRRQLSGRRAGPGCVRLVLRGGDHQDALGEAPRAAAGPQPGGLLHRVPPLLLGVQPGVRRRLRVPAVAVVAGRRAGARELRGVRFCRGEVFAAVRFAGPAQVAGGQSPLRGRLLRGCLGGRDDARAGRGGAACGGVRAKAGHHVLQRRDLRQCPESSCRVGAGGPCCAASRLRSGERPEVLDPAELLG
mmetsp:Transcript_12206/g.32419  ORF Transcript_12206/g.32419 Transcript_12206/m.32419 type:complete len:317 (-) Transcript_12206:254-1204(-)